MKYKYFPASIFSFIVLELIFCRSASNAHLTQHHVLNGNPKEWHRAEKYIKDVIKTKLEEGALRATNLSKTFPDFDGDEVEYINEIDSWLKSDFDDDDYPDNQVLILSRDYIDKNKTDLS